VDSDFALRIVDTETNERWCRDLRGVVHPYAEVRRMMERIAGFMMVLSCVLVCCRRYSALHDELCLSLSSRRI
jgi:hypothetical protein